MHGSKTELFYQLDLSFAAYPDGVHGSKTELFVGPQIAGEEARNSVFVVAPNLTIYRRVYVEGQET